MKFPEFSLLLDTGDIITESSFSQGIYVLFSYPKDSTPGCTQENKDFSDFFERFEALGVSVFGLSKDSVSSHCSFKSKHAINVPLLSDPERSLLTKLGLVIEKTMYGKPVRSTERATFIIHDGTIVHAFRNVSVPHHAAEVFAWIESYIQK